MLGIIFGTGALALAWHARRNFAKNSEPLEVEEKTSRKIALLRQWRDLAALWFALAEKHVEHPEIKEFKLMEKVEEMTDNVETLKKGAYTGKIF